MTRWLFALPLALFVALAAWVAVPLIRGDDPAVLSSALINRPAPEFSLPPLPGRADGLASADLGGRPVLVNVFASWCAPCLAEHPLLMRLSGELAVPILGINHRDEPADALAWLARHGDPFERIGADREGRVSIDWGVYGVPETFVVDGGGRIRFRHAGPLTPDLVEDTVLPLLGELQQ